MPADHLTANSTTALSPPTAATPAHAVQGVLAVLSGAPLDHAAAEIGMTPADLADAARTYQQAGYIALETQAQADWYQAHLELPHGSGTEHILATSLAPRLQHLYDTGVITAWWFIRKAPGLRLRITPASSHRALDTLLTELTTAGALTHWRHTLYEPEDAAFGGPPGMDIAHDLFSADSHHILAYLRHERPPIGRRELSMLLCTTLFRAAQQEWFECGDIWHRIARYRPTPPTTGALDQLTTQLRTLLTHNPHPTGPLFGSDGTLAVLAPWAAAFHHTGHALATAASNGTLHRGTRAVLAHHVIFHWNRLGLSLPTQSILAHTAAAIVLDQ